MHRFTTLICKAIDHKMCIVFYDSFAIAEFQKTSKVGASVIWDLKRAEAAERLALQPHPIIPPAFTCLFIRQSIHPVITLRGLVLHVYPTKPDAATCLCCTARSDIIYVSRYQAIAV